MSCAHPTYEALLAAKPKAPAGATSLDFLRLRWTLGSDSLYSSITILKDATNANSPQEPYSPTHPVSQSALTSPPVSALIVSIEILDDYATKWIEVHREHAEPEDSPDHNDELFDAEGILEHCCGQDRPGPGLRLEIVADDLVTIGQCASMAARARQPVTSRQRRAELLATRSGHRHVCMAEQSKSTTHRWP